jgi:hypothetical protein
MPRQSRQFGTQVTAAPATYLAAVVYLVAGALSAHQTRRLMRADLVGNGEAPFNSLRLNRLRGQQSEETRSPRWDCDMLGLRPLPPSSRQVGGDQISQVGLRRLTPRARAFSHWFVGGDQISQVGLRLWMRLCKGIQHGTSLVGGDQISQVGLRLCGCQPWEPYRRTSSRRRPDQPGGIATRGELLSGPPFSLSEETRSARWDCDF